MTDTERNAMRDLLANAQAARKAAADLPEGVTEPQKEHYRKQRFRLELGALDCEAVAAFIYWRNQPASARPNAARQAPQAA